MASSFLCKDRHGGYLFRRIMPRKFRKILGGMREIRHSLSTYHRPTALVRARRYAVITDELFEKLDSITLAITESQDQISRLIENRDTAKSNFETLTDLLKDCIESNELEDWPTMNEGLVTLLALMEKEETSKRDIAIAEQRFNALAEMQKKLATTIATNQVQEEFGHLVDNSTAAQTATKRLQKESPLISQVWEDYHSEQRNNWTEGTIKEINEAYRSFLEIIGDMPIEAVSIDEIRLYKRELNDYPLRRTVSTNAGKTLAELRAASEKRLSPATVANRMTLVNAFLAWAERHKYLASNPLEGVTAKRDHNRESRDAFDLHHLALIFSHPRFTEGEYKNDWEFWLPILGLYTGCRMGELCQLRGSDLKDKDGIYYFNIHEAGENKLKTRNSTRKIPINQLLIDTGILELRKKGNDYLFDLKVVNGKRSHYPSKRFGEFKRALGLDARKSFHSFRHTFRNALSEAGTQDHVVSTLMGHSQRNITFSVYGNAASLEMLDNAVQKLSFGRALNRVQKQSS